MIAFYVGNVSLGSAPAVSTLTPKELAMMEKQDLNLSIRDDSVLNRVRFLLSLDANTTKTGIQIDSKTINAAKKWKEVDFSLSPDRFTQELQENTDLNASQIVSKQTALQHFSASLRCVYSGAYRGKWILPDGKRSGYVGILIQADGKIVALGDGQQIGENNDSVIYSVGQHDIDTGTYTFINNTYYYDPQSGFVISAALSDINGSGASIGYDKVAGEFTQNGVHGYYEALRVAKGQHSVYRFTGFGYRNDGGGIGMFTLDLEQNGSVTGMIHDSRNNSQPSIFGSIDYKTGSLQVKIASNPAIIMEAENIYEHYPDINLSWRSEDGLETGYARGIGCRLESY